LNNNNEMSAIRIKPRLSGRSPPRLSGHSTPRMSGHSTDDDSDDDEQYRVMRATLTAEEYDVATIKAEFKSYQSILPKPDKLLQQQHSFEMLREMIQDSKVEMPRFLKYGYEGGIRPHHALCCLLLNDSPTEAPKERGLNLLGSWIVWFLSFGSLHRQHNRPAGIIYEQFNRVAHVIPAEMLLPEELRKRIRNSGLPIPNFFLDPESDKQFPPHIALLVVLQEGEKESKFLGSPINRVAWFWFAFIALILRLVLEVIGGAGAIWGGSEVFYLRNETNKEQCRAASIVVGIFCFLRFVILNAPQNEDEGDILGPAGPWSLRAPARLRAVFEHPFHYFVRAREPYYPSKQQRSLHISK